MNWSFWRFYKLTDRLQLHNYVGMLKIKRKLWWCIFSPLTAICYPSLNLIWFDLNSSKKKKNFWNILITKFLPDYRGLPMQKKKKKVKGQHLKTCSSHPYVAVTGLPESPILYMVEVLWCRSLFIKVFESVSTVEYIIQGNLNLFKGIRNFGVQFYVDTFNFTYIAYYIL